MGGQNSTMEGVQLALYLPAYEKSGYIKIINLAINGMNSVPFVSMRSAKANTLKVLSEEANEKIVM